MKSIIPTNPKQQYVLVVLSQRHWNRGLLTQWSKTFSAELMTLLSFLDTSQHIKLRTKVSCLKNKTDKWLLRNQFHHPHGFSFEVKEIRAWDAKTASFLSLVTCPSSSYDSRYI